MIVRMTFIAKNAVKRDAYDRVWGGVGWCSQREAQEVVVVVTWLHAVAPLRALEDAVEFAVGLAANVEGRVVVEARAQGAADEVVALLRGLVEQCRRHDLAAVVVVEGVVEHLPRGMAAGREAGRVQGELVVAERGGEDTEVRA